MNRNKLIDIFVSNLANAIIHQILEKAIDKKEISEGYHKEIKNSWEIANKYRQKINPINRSFPDKDFEEIKERVTKKVLSELNLRIQKGYENINLSLVNEFVEKALKSMGLQ